MLSFVLCYCTEKTPCIQALCSVLFALLLLFVFFTNHPYRLRFYGARSIFMSVHAWALSKILFDGLAAKLR